MAEELEVESVLAWSDGASRGNPGLASVGVVLKSEDGRLLESIGQKIGRCTNNVAEYQAVRTAMTRALALGARRLVLHADSELVIRQLTGIYRVKHEDLKPLFAQIKALEAKFSQVIYKHVRRALNTEADAAANRALDSP